MSDSFRPCAIVPTYENPTTVRAAVEAIRTFELDVILVDDGSSEPGRRACEAIAADGLATLVQRATNRGKGAAVKAGFAKALAEGFTHGFQIDADCQHQMEQIPTFLDAAEAEPEALILAYPVYGASAPRSRTIARGLTTFWVNVEVGSRARIKDAMIGFRVYPLEAALASGTRADRMDFDIEIAVKMARMGIPIRNLPVAIMYPEDGVSHFDMVRDNLRFCALHARLCTGGSIGWVRRALFGGRA